MHAQGVQFKRADNRRVGKRGAFGGWDEMRNRMLGHDDGPLIFCFSTCTDSIRTIPVLQHDQRKPEDLDTTAEDHAADEWRYACMSRPWTKSKQKRTTGAREMLATVKDLLGMERRFAATSKRI
jgi:hypothetical protein